MMEDDNIDNNYETEVASGPTPYINELLDEETLLLLKIYRSTEDIPMEYDKFYRIAKGAFPSLKNSVIQSTWRKVIGRAISHRLSIGSLVVASLTPKNSPYRVLEIKLASPRYCPDLIPPPLYSSESIIISSSSDEAEGDVDFNQPTTSKTNLTINPSVASSNSVDLNQPMTSKRNLTIHQSVKSSSNKVTPASSQTNTTTYQPMISSSDGDDVGVNFNRSTTSQSNLTFYQSLRSNDEGNQSTTLKRSLTLNHPLGSSNDEDNQHRTSNENQALNFSKGSSSDKCYEPKITERHRTRNHPTGSSSDEDDQHTTSKRYRALNHSMGSSSGVNIDLNQPSTCKSNWNIIQSRESSSDEENVDFNRSTTSKRKSMVSSSDEDMTDDFKLVSKSKIRAIESPTFTSSHSNSNKDSQKKSCDELKAAIKKKIFKRIKSKQDVSPLNFKRIKKNLKRLLTKQVKQIMLAKSTSEQKIIAKVHDRLVDVILHKYFN